MSGEDVTVSCNLCGAHVSADRESAQAWMNTHAERFHPHPKLEARALQLLAQAPRQDLVPMLREHLQRELAMAKTDRGLRMFIANMERNARSIDAGV